MPIANIHVSVRAFPIRLGTTQGAHYHHFFFSISIGSLNQCNQIKKRIKDNQIEKEEAKCLLFADVMILYTKNHKDFTKKLL